MGVLTPRRATICLASLWLGALSLAAESGNESPPAAYSEYEIESAMLYNFAKFVEWPAGALGNSGDPVIVGVFGDGGMASVLAAALRAKTVYGHPLVMRRLNSAADMKRCAIVFVGETNRQEIARIVQAVRESPVLTIGANAQFSRQGGVIAFIREGRRMRFEINLDAADRAGLTVSSKLLRLASVWRESPPRARN